MLHIRNLTHYLLRIACFSFPMCRISVRSRNIKERYIFSRFLPRSLLYHINSLIFLLLVSWTHPIVQQQCSSSAIVDDELIVGIAWLSSKNIKKQHRVGSAMLFSFCSFVIFLTLQSLAYESTFLQSNFVFVYWCDYDNSETSRPASARNRRNGLFFSVR